MVIKSADRLTGLVPHGLTHILCFEKKKKKEKKQKKKKKSVLCLHRFKVNTRRACKEGKWLNREQTHLPLK